MANDLNAALPSIVTSPIVLLMFCVLPVFIIVFGMRSSSPFAPIIAFVGMSASMLLLTLGLFPDLYAIIPPALPNSAALILAVTIPAVNADKPETLRAQILYATGIVMVTAGVCGIWVPLEMWLKVFSGDTSQMLLMLVPFLGVVVLGSLSFFRPRREAAQPEAAETNAS